MESSRSIEREPTEILCSFDDQRGITIHRFEAGKCQCRCGKKIVRQPQKRARLKFGRVSEDTDFI